jgi:hypothetical protein
MQNLNVLAAMVLEPALPAAIFLKANCSHSRCVLWALLTGKPKLIAIVVAVFVVVPVAVVVVTGVVVVLAAAVEVAVEVAAAAVLVRPGGRLLFAA